MDAPGRSDSFQPGQSFGRFYLVQVIGEGGTSRIFKALQQPINRLVALKIPSFADTGTILTPDEFLSEATLMARIEHGHVVRIYDFGVQEDRAFICMEYVEGWNLLELIQARGPLPVSAVLGAGIQTLEGLLYAHSQGVLHMDLSPANVLISKTGTAKLSDFGMAGKKFKASEGRIVGTPAFLSPEHVTGAPGTARSDLFSFASLLYYAATGEPLFDPGEGNSRVTEAMREIECARANPPEGRLKRLPRLLAKPVATALESKDPERLMRELRDAWKKLEGEERPESVLRRELELEADPLAHGSSPDDLPAGEELRERYVRLREGGKHREAVALLEKALRKQPDNPILRELLAAPPAKVKSAPVTVDVGAPNPSRGNGIASSGPASTRHAQSKGPFRLAAAIAVILAVTVGLLAWGRTRNAFADRANASPETGTRTPAAQAQGIPAGGNAPAAVPVTAKVSDGTGFAGSKGDRAYTPDARPAVQAGFAGKADARPAAPRKPRPPAVALSGPAGTKVVVDDSIEWTSPGPAGGWPITPGLVNITLTPPGSNRPISSSLFISADTLYLLNLEADGGFSVSRKRR
ncbi:MAG: protein kinase [Fibrobacteres bacterium]|nr:protein kinase [Fibrobacterota bacterium]